MREVFDRLETLSLPYFLTGSEALARYGQPRETMDEQVLEGVAPAGEARGVHGAVVGERGRGPAVGLARHRGLTGSVGRV